MIYIARAGSFKDGDEIEIPEDSIGITTEKTVMLSGLVVTWLEPKKVTLKKEVSLCKNCFEDCSECKLTNS